MNSVNLIGRMVKAADLTASSNGQSIARFTIAIDRGKDKNGESKGTDFITCKAFGRTAENIDNYCTKGSLIGINGRIQTGSYEKDGRTVYTTDVIAERVNFLSKAQTVTNEPEAPEGFTKVNEDIPF